MKEYPQLSAWRVLDMIHVWEAGRLVWIVQTRGELPDEAIS